MDKVTGFKKFIADRAVAAKIDNLKKSSKYTHGVYDKIVFNKPK